MSDESKGFLPFHTNAFDRVFVAVVTGIIFFLVFLRFLDDRVSIWVPFMIWVGWLYTVVRKG